MARRSVTPAINLGLLSSLLICVDVAGGEWCLDYLPMLSFRI